MARTPTPSAQQSAPIDYVGGGVSSRTVRPRRRSTPTSIEGSSGIIRYAGYIREERNALLYGREGIRIYEEMLSTESTIQALFDVTVLPLVSADWSMQVGGVVPETSLKRDIKRAEEIRKFCEDAVFKRTNRPFEEILVESMMHLIWGFSVQELGLYEADGKLWIKDLYTRHPRSIIQASPPWLFDGDELVGVNQRDIYNTDTAQVTLDPTVLLVLTNKQVGTNVQGRSMLRACYRPYIIKKELTNILNIGLEKQAVGTPYGKMGDVSSTPKREAELRTAVQNIRNGEYSSVVLPAGWDIMNLEGKVKAAELESVIRYQDEQMTLAWLANFLLLGHGQSTGGYALSADQSDLFMIAEDAKAEYISGKWYKLLKYLVELNYGKDAVQYTPHLKASIQKVSLSQLVDMWQKLGAGNNALFTLSDTDEDYLRQRVGAPPRTEERRPFAPEGPQPGGNQPPQKPAPSGPPPVPPGRQGRRTAPKNDEGEDQDE